MTKIIIPNRILEALGDRSARVVVSTGAGISAESGVPTFRSAGGLWKDRKAESLATPEAFAADPGHVWEWYAHRREIISNIRPNPGHFALARWEHHFESFVLITQNVDGLHARAGSLQPIELHGNIMQSRCVSCGQDAGLEEPAGDGALPYCPCGGLIRPNVVWFGEPLPERALQRAWEAAEGADVFLSIGTSGVVQPAASFAGVARQAGAFLIEINPEETEISYTFAEVLRYPSGVILPELSRKLGIPVGDPE